MALLYHFAVLGAPSDAQISELHEAMSNVLNPFGLTLGENVGWEVKPNRFSPDHQTAAAAVYFGAEGASDDSLGYLLQRGVPILPVASTSAAVGAEIPSPLQNLNCLTLDAGGTPRIATALLECAGLLPRQRRVFLSYKRNESREAAVQLFNELSERLFDVFLDTHGIPPAEDFQTMLWHRLCDSDVLLMLDTPNYFNSRWTNAEFGRALSKGISILRVGWPDSTPSDRVATTSRVELLPNELDSVTGRIEQDAIERICTQLEVVRSQSHAVRHLNLVSGLRNAIQSIGGRLLGVGAQKGIHIALPDKRRVVVYPTVGVPTSSTLHEACINSPEETTAVLFDHVGLHPRWLEHLDWLGGQVTAARWIKASEASFRFADWN
nr:toll/interleukin-1 receptor domain-containing protein [Luteibacter rhizovicinus]